jgi:hypothetical protein
MTPEDMNVVHRRIDDLQKVQGDHARIMERQVVLTETLAKLLDRTAAKADANEAGLAKWVNRGVGAYAVLGVLATLGFFKFFPVASAAASVISR